MFDLGHLKATTLAVDAARTVSPPFEIFSEWLDKLDLSIMSCPGIRLPLADSGRFSQVRSTFTAKRGHHSQHSWRAGP